MKNSKGNSACQETLLAAKFKKNETLHLTIDQSILIGGHITVFMNTVSFRPSRVFIPQTFKRIRIGVVSFCLATLLLNSTAKGELLYANATSGPPTLIGLVLGSGQLAGMRFQLSSSAIIDGIGGNIQVSSTIGNGIIFGALVRLTNLSDYPDSIDLSTPDTLATVAFSASPNFTDVTVPITPLTVQPGDYALVLGSGLFGATGEGSMSTDNPNFVDSSTFVYDTFNNSWEEYGADGGLRFTVFGVSVPEPSSALLMLFLALIFVCQPRLKCGLIRGQAPPVKPITNLQSPGRRKA